MSMKTKNDQNLAIDALESLIPEHASKATHSAHIRALAASARGVLCVDAGELVRVSQDGSRTVIAKAKPRRKVTVGEVITVRKVEAQTADGRA